MKSDTKAHTLTVPFIGNTYRKAKVTWDSKTEIMTAKEAKKFLSDVVVSD